MSKSVGLGSVARFLPIGLDMERAVAFYEQELGFNKVREVGRFVPVVRDETKFILAKDDNEELAKGLMLRVDVEDIDALHEEYQGKNIPHLGEIEMQSWGGWAFSLKDPWEILFWFCEPIK